MSELRADSGHDHAASNHDQVFVVDTSDAGNMSMLSNPAGCRKQQQQLAATETMSPAAGKDDLVRSIASRACLGCRRLKMKCVGAADPPCARCVKSGRKCEFLQPGQPTPAQLQRRPWSQANEAQGAVERPAATETSPRNQTHGIAVDSSRQDEQKDQFKVSSVLKSYGAPSWTPITPETTATYGAITKYSEPPSVYSKSPWVMVDERTRSLASDKTHSDIQEPPLKRRRIAGNARVSEDGMSEPISERDMEQLLELFQERILGFIPILGPEDFGDMPNMLSERKALLHCICYVTARFVPGGSAIRDRLFQPVSDFLLGISETNESTSTHSLSILQGLIVLYAYAQSVPTAVEGSLSPPKEFLFWRIKTFTEAHAMKLFLHRSIEGLRAAVAAQESNILTSYYYKTYTYWLWLYTMAHHGSMATRTPPTIRADSSIRAAPKLLNQIGTNARISRLIGDVELCLSWEQVSIQETELGEWWCKPEPDMNRDTSNRDSMEELQATLNRWTHRWSAFITEGSNFRGTNLDFHIRFTQFCITTYSIRPLKIYSSSSDTLLPAQKDAIAKCVDAASQVVAWALDLGPVGKDRLRYFCDFGFLRRAFCAFFILQAFQAFGSVIPHHDEYLDIVAEAAQLMTELAIDSKHAPAVYGKSILLLLEEVRKPGRKVSNTDTKLQEATLLNPRSQSWRALDGHHVVGHSPSSFVPDQTLDFTSLFPDMLWN